MSQPVNSAHSSIKMQTPREVRNQLQPLWAAIENGQFEKANSIFALINATHSPMQATLNHKVLEKYNASVGSESPRSEKYTAFFLGIRQTLSALFPQLRNL